MVRTNHVVAKELVHRDGKGVGDVEERWQAQLGVSSLDVADMSNRKICPFSQRLLGHSRLDPRDLDSQSNGFIVNFHQKHPLFHSRLPL